MENLINAIKKSLQNNNWYSSLFMALSMPDICGKINSPKRKSKDRYIDWFDKYISDKYKHNGQTFLSGDDCYALRCSYFHKGTDVIIHQYAQKILDKFIFVSNIKSHCNTIKINGNLALQVNVELFCKDFINGAEQWLRNFSKTETEIEIIKIHDRIIPIGTNTLS